MVFWLLFVWFLCSLGKFLRMSAELEFTFYKIKYLEFSCVLWSFLTFFVVFSPMFWRKSLCFSVPLDHFYCIFPKSKKFWFLLVCTFLCESFRNLLSCRVWGKKCRKVDKKRVLTPSYFSDLCNLDFGYEGKFLLKLSWSSSFPAALNLMVRCNTSYDLMLSMNISLSQMSFFFVQ